MACVLTGSQALDCRDAIGGIKEIKVKKHPGLTTTEADFTVSSGSITAIATGSRTLWYTYGVEKETASLASNTNPNTQQGTNFYTQEIKIILNKLSTRLNEEMRLLAVMPLLFAVRDFNDNYWIVGKDFGADLTTGTSGTGAARGDRSGYDLTFTAKEPLTIQNITKTIYDTLVS